MRQIALVDPGGTSSYASQMDRAFDGNDATYGWLGNLPGDTYGYAWFQDHAAKYVVKVGLLWNSFGSAGYGLGLFLGNHATNPMASGTSLGTAPALSLPGNLTYTEYTLTTPILARSIYLIKSFNVAPFDAYIYSVNVFVEDVPRPSAPRLQYTTSIQAGNPRISIIGNS